MEIKVEFDDELLKEYEKRNSSPFFKIVIEQEGQFYPSKNWMDFGAVILNWWIDGLLHLLNSGRCQEFLFMEGNYEIKIRHRRSSKMMELQPLGIETIWKISPEAIAESVLQAAETVIKKLAQLDIGKRERKALKNSAEQLRKVLSDRISSRPVNFVPENEELQELKDNRSQAFKPVTKPLQVYLTISRTAIILLNSYSWRRVRSHPSLI